MSVFSQNFIEREGKNGAQKYKELARVRRASQPHVRLKPSAIQNSKLDSINSKHVTEGMGGEMKQLPFQRIIRAPMSKMV